MRLTLIASVAIDNSTAGFDKLYDYIIPQSLTSNAKRGRYAYVPFGRSNKLRGAFIINVRQDICDTQGLKEISSIEDSFDGVDEELLKIAEWMKTRYVCTYSDAIRVMLPSGTGIPGKTDVSEKKIKVAYLSADPCYVVEDIESGRFKRIQHIRVLQMLIENEYIAVHDLMKFAGVSKSVLDTLKKNGYIDYKQIEVIRDPLAHKNIEPVAAPELNDEQKYVVDKLERYIDSNIFSEHLLHGVTSSGKTEVYMQLITKVIQQGRHAIMLVPEIALTPQTVERFQSRFGKEVAVFHSRLSTGERYDQWRLARDGQIKVMIGARSAVFAPFKDLGIIIVDEEHETSYKSEITPKYHAIEVARQRCLNSGALLLLGSATPSVETYFRAVKNAIGLFKLKYRANNSKMPFVELVDMRKELQNGNKSIFSIKLQEEIKHNIQKNRQTILFLNRRGYASFVLCRSCGYVIKCRECNITMTYHLYDDRLVCHYCGYTIKPPKNCPACASTYIRHFGAGTQKVEDEVRKIFPHASVIRMDLDTTSAKNSHEEILKRFKEENINILVGTQMIAKGHDFPNVTLVGVLAADSLLNIEDFRASERTFQLITQVAGRAGRGSEEGKVIIQTYNTEDFSILAACSQDYEMYYNKEIIIRKELKFPPFCNISIIVVSGEDDKQCFLAAKTLLSKTYEFLQCDKTVAYSAQEEYLILGPARCPLSKIRNKFRWRIVIKHANLDNLIRVSAKLNEFSSKELFEKQKLDVSIDINPYSML